MGIACLICIDSGYVHFLFLLSVNTRHTGCSMVMVCSFTVGSPVVLSRAKTCSSSEEALATSRNFPSGEMQKFLGSLPRVEVIPTRESFPDAVSR